MDYTKPTHIEINSRWVDVWFHSPSGDASDSQIFRIHCRSAEQAEIVAQQWAIKNEMVWYDQRRRAVDPFVETRLGSEVL